jgi:hypothetical protein
MTMSNKTLEELVEETADKKAGKKTRKARPKAPEAAKDQPTDGMAPLSKYQIFAPMRVNRRDIKELPFNSDVRYMDDFTKEKLRDSIKAGLFKAPIWNKNMC